MKPIRMIYTLTQEMMYIKTLPMTKSFDVIPYSSTTLIPPEIESSAPSTLEKIAALPPEMIPI